MKLGNDHGFTMMEALVSSAVLAVGVLGMAAMQGIALNKNVDANDLSVVTNIAADMMERIQNNRNFAWAYDNLQTMGVGNCAALPPVPPPGVTKTTSPPIIQLIQGDCTQWRTLVLASNLTNVQGTVTVTNAAPANTQLTARNVVVRLTWNDRNAAGPTARQRVVAFASTVVPEQIQ
jgi:type IV pilus assembly protein PilV